MSEKYFEGRDKYGLQRKFYFEDVVWLRPIKNVVDDEKTEYEIRIQNEGLVNVTQEVYEEIKKIKKNKT